MSHRADMSGRRRNEDLFVQHNGVNSKTALIEPWLGVDDLAHVLGVSTDWVYEKAAAGELPSYKFGGHRRFRVSEVEDWASRRAHGKMTRVGTEETTKTLTDGLHPPA
jgi:excisionase family DNA binding protein